MADKDHLKDLRDRINRGLKRRKWKRGKLAVKSHIPASTVKRILESDRDPQWTTACKLLSALEDDAA